MTSIAPIPSTRDEGRDGMASPSPVPADPFSFLAEKCRKEFCRRWQEDNGDAIDTATLAYGE